MSRRYWFQLTTFASFSVVSVLYLFLAYRHEFSGVISDSLIYLLMADYYSPVVDVSEDFYRFIIENYSFPPLYPILLGLVGGGSHSPELSYMLSALLLVSALFIYLQWNQRVLNSAISSLLLVMLVALMPVTLRHVMLIVSEHLYLLLVLSGFLMLEKAKEQPGHLIVAGVLFGLGMLTRTVGVAAVFAFIATVLLKKNSRYKYIAMLAAVFPPACWFLIKPSVEGSGYISDFIKIIEGDIVRNLVEQLYVNFKLLWLYWVRLFDSQGSEYAEFGAMVILIFIIIGFVYRLIDMKPDAVYMAGYTFILLLWPYPDQLDRFLFVILPFLLTYGLVGVSQSSVALHTSYMRKGVGILYLVLVGVIISPTLSEMLVRFNHPAGDDFSDYVRTPTWLNSQDPWRTRGNMERMRRIYTSMQRGASLVPQEGCVFSVAPPYLMFYMRRKSLHIPSLENDGAFAKGTVSCGYIFMMAVASFPDMGIPPMYPAQQILSEVDVMQVSYRTEGDPGSNVLSMLVSYPTGSSGKVE